MALALPSHDGRPASPRRRSIASAYANAALAGAASGLANVTLVTYFAHELGASGLAFAWLMAAPSLAGMLRLWTPTWLARSGSLRRFCITMFLGAAAVLAVLPAAAAPGALASKQHSIVAMGAAWAGAQALEGIGVVALWTWLGELVPARVRGRFVGRREAWLTGGWVVGTLLSAGFTWFWFERCKKLGTPELEWQAYAACTWWGAALMAAATLPLAPMIEPPRIRPSTADVPATRWRDLWAPLADPRFRRFLAFGAWFSVANGLIQPAQTKFMIGPLGLSYGLKKILDSSSRGGQILLLPWAGRVADRRGSVRLLTASWAVAAMAALFFLLAGRFEWRLILGAYALWLAYAGVNVALPNLMLGLSPPGKRPAYAAAWFAWTQLAFSLSLLAGGWLFDRLAAAWKPVVVDRWRIDHFFILFLVSWALKSVGIPLAARIAEPQPRGDGDNAVTGAVPRAGA